MKIETYFFLCISALWLWQMSERAGALGRRRLDILMTAVSHLLYAILLYYAWVGI